MQSPSRRLVAVWAAIGLMEAFGATADSARAADRPTSAADVGSSAVTSGDSAPAANLLQLGRRRIGQVTPAAASPEPVDAPPVPIDPDAPAAAATVDPTPADPGSGVVRPGVGAMPLHRPFGPAGRSALHERLRQKRLGRIQQMRQSAEQNGDSKGAQRAQYLEGMVNELHNQGLFNFAQKVIGAIQEGKLNAAGAGQDASAGSVEMPEADLGEAAPLPNSELGEPAPLPTDDAKPLPDAQSTPETGPRLPPATTSDDGGDAPPANN